MKNWFYPALILWVVVMLCAGCSENHPELTGYLPVEGGHIWYRFNGMRHRHDKPAIVVIHGGPGGSHRSLLPYLSLADTYPVVFYDQLDSGKSTRTNNSAHWTVARFISEIEVLRHRLGLGDVVVAGHSWGGLLAAEYASKKPEGLRALILSSPLISTRQWLADNQRWIDELPNGAAASIRHHQAAGTTDHPDYREAKKIFRKRHMCRRQPCPKADYLEGAPGLNRAIYEYMWGPSEFHATGVLVNLDISAGLPAIKAPTLMICGEFDEAAPWSCERYAGMIPQSTTVIVPEAGHATLRENEVFYLDSVRKFLTAELE